MKKIFCNSWKIATFAFAKETKDIITCMGFFMPLRKRFFNNHIRLFA